MDGTLQLRTSPSQDTTDCLVAKTKLKLISQNTRSAMCANCNSALAVAGAANMMHFA